MSKYDRRKRKRSFVKMFVVVNDFFEDHEKLTGTKDTVRNDDRCPSLSDIPSPDVKQTYPLHIVNNEIAIDLHVNQLSEKKLDNDSQKKYLPSFQQALRKWAIESNISQTHLTSLLHLHSTYLPQLNLPKTAGSLLSQNISTTNIVSDTFSYIGIQKSAEHLLPSLPSQCLNLMINFDGISFFKSSAIQCWPILGYFQELKEFPFLIGIFYGKGKPNISEYLETFVNDVNTVTKHGFVAHGSTWKISSLKFVTDAPARSLVKGIKYPSGYSCCDKCDIEGEYSLEAKCVIFPDTFFSKRTDDEFRRQSDSCHHRTASPLIKIEGIDIITSFVIDSMHCVYLGTMRRMMSSWISGKAYKARLPFATLNFLSLSIKRISPYMPSEFCRRPRGLDEIKYWKATEYRMFLLYVGVVVLNDEKIPLCIYKNFLLLHSAIMLLNMRSYEHNKDVTYELLQDFVKDCKSLYGKAFCSYNVHTLLHLTDDCSLHGPLDDHSAFPFENYLQILKKRIRSGNQVITQAINRVGDLRHLTNPFYKRSIKFSPSVRDRCLISSDKKVGLIQEVVSKDTFLVKMFSNSDDFFKEPICSSDLGIFSVNTRDLLEPTLIHRDNVLTKACALPYKESFVVIPLLKHS